MKGNGKSGGLRGDMDKVITTVGMGLCGKKETNMQTETSNPIHYATNLVQPPTSRSSSNAASRI